jgi:hypothetical protein
MSIKIKWTGDKTYKNGIGPTPTVGDLLECAEEILRKRDEWNFYKHGTDQRIINPKFLPRLRKLLKEKLHDQ